MNSQSGIGIGGLLLVAFVVLKLTKVITWSWWWVLSPAWIGVAIGLVALIIVLIVTLVQTIRERR
jgi:hypothetical protein